MVHGSLKLIFPFCVYGEKEFNAPVHECVAHPFLMQLIQLKKSLKAENSRSWRERFHYQPHGPDVLYIKRKKSALLK